MAACPWLRAILPPVPADALVSRSALSATLISICSVDLMQGANVGAFDAASVIDQDMTLARMANVMFGLASAGRLCSGACHNWFAG